MIKNLPVIVLILVVVYVLYTTQLVHKIKNEITDLTGIDIYPQQAQNAQHNMGPQMESGMYEIPNPNAFGTTLEQDRRITNDGVRKEYHTNPFPWAECTCSTGNCDKHGVPSPAPGQTHVCKYGFPSKRIVDMYGGHFQLNHICSPGLEDGCYDEPATLGRWWGCKKGCSNAESVGLNIRPSCTRCG